VASTTTPGAAAAAGSHQPWSPMAGPDQRHCRDLCGIGRDFQEDVASISRREVTRSSTISPSCPVGDPNAETEDVWRDDAR